MDVELDCFAAPPESDDAPPPRPPWGSTIEVRWLCQAFQTVRRLNCSVSQDDQLDRFLCQMFPDIDAPSEHSSQPSATLTTDYYVPGLDGQLELLPHGSQLGSVPSFGSSQSITSKGSSTSVQLLGAMSQEQVEAAAQVLGQSQYGHCPALGDEFRIGTLAVLKVRSNCGYPVAFFSN